MKSNNPWFNDRINILIKVKNKNYGKWKKYGHLYSTLKDIYIKSKNICTKAIRNAKNEYIYNTIYKNQHNPKLKWKIIGHT